MNQLELILENLRLSYIENLLTEAQTEAELYRGIDLINESIQIIAENLIQEAVHAGDPMLDKNKMNRFRNNGDRPGLLRAADIQANRSDLTKAIKENRANRDYARSQNPNDRYHGGYGDFNHRTNQEAANFADNNARFLSLKPNAHIKGMYFTKQSSRINPEADNSNIYYNRVVGNKIINDKEQQKSELMQAQIIGKNGNLKYNEVANNNEKFYTPYAPAPYSLLIRNLETAPRLMNMAHQ